MAWLSDGERILKIYLFFFTEFTNVTDTQTDTQTHTETPHDGIGRAYALHRAAKTKLKSTSSLVELLILCASDFSGKE